MTDFALTDIPPNVRTVEKLAVWCAEVLQNLYPNATVVDFLDENGEPVQSRAIQSNKFFYDAVAPAEWRHASRMALRITNQHQVSGNVYNHVIDLGQLPIPAGMKA